MSQAATGPESDVLASVAGEIDEYLTRVLRGRGMPGMLEEAVCYTVLAHGKRLRPALVVLCCQAVEGRREQAMAPAASIELIHSFSLVHDDLPAMDDDDMRRGQPTLHKHAGEAMAILAGDAMMSIAFELIAASTLPAERVGRLCRELASATSAMIDGQVYDTLGGFPDRLSEEQRLGLIHRNKTGALLRAACRMGGVCGGAGERQLLHLTEYGEAIGLMFQIVDDLLDVTESTEHIGKTAGKDLPAGKLTYPGVLGIERSRRDIERLRAEAHVALEGLGDTAAVLGRLCDDMAVRTK